MLILNAADVRQALPMPLAVEAMKQAFAAFSSGQALVPPRIHLAIAPHAGVSLFMPSFVDAASSAEQALAVKVASVFDGNPARGLARIQAAVVVLEPDTGRSIALLDGEMLTAIRTAAASGAATELLARRDCRTLALFGAGVQARTHLEAMCSVRSIDTIRVFSRTPRKVAEFVEYAVRVLDQSAHGSSSPNRLSKRWPTQTSCVARPPRRCRSSRTPISNPESTSTGLARTRRSLAKCLRRLCVAHWSWSIAVAPRGTRRATSFNRCKPA